MEHVDSGDCKIDFGMTTTGRVVVFGFSLTALMAMWSCDSGQVARERERKDSEALKAFNEQMSLEREQFVRRLSPEVRMCRDRLVRELATANERLVALRKRESDLKYGSDVAKLSVIRRMIALVEGTRDAVKEQLERLNIEIERGASLAERKSAESIRRLGLEVMRASNAFAKADQSAKELRRLNGEVSAVSGADPSSYRKTRVEDGGHGQSDLLNHVKAGDLFRVVGVPANDRLNVREEPNHSSRILFSIPSTASGVVYLGPTQRYQGAVWFRVQFGGGVGFVNAGYLSPR